MPTEPTLRHLFDAPQPDNQIDVAAIVRRSRARRAPKVFATAGVSVLAVGGMLFGGIQFANGLSTSTLVGAADEPAMVQAEDGAASTQYDAEVKRSAATDMNQCEAPVVQPQPSESGLVLAVNFPDAVADGGYLIGEVTLTNAGTQSWTGYTLLDPTVTLARDGVVVWHTHAPVGDATTAVQLEPGQSITYKATVMAVVCSASDEGDGGFHADLPPAPAGEYQISAALDLYGDFDAQLITGPAQTITLR